MATKIKLGVYFWLKVSMMMVTLVAVLYTIYALNNPGTKNLIELLAGASGQGAQSRVKLCPTRVSSISIIGKTALFQDGLKWFRTTEGQRQELDPIAVEKWFSEYCTVGSEPASPPASQPQPVVTFAYVAGLPVTLQQSEGGVFTLNGVHFRSEKLVEAIQAVTTLPEATQRK
jgi:hypothetical protein